MKADDARLGRAGALPQTLEERLEAGFKAADAHFAEQRQYTELAFSTLTKRIDSVERRMDARCDASERRVTGQFEAVGQRLNTFEQKLDRVLVLVSRRHRGRPK
jgi:hypothetical protein